MPEFQMPDVSPYLNQMMEYWGPMMDVGLERAQAMPEREGIAFDQYLRRKRKEDQLAEEAIKKSQLERKYARREYSKDVLSAAPKSAHTQAMSRARTAGDVEDYLTQRRVGGIEKTRRGMVERTKADPRGWGPSTMGSFESFGHAAPAAALHGVDIYAGHPTGFDQYAKLASGGRNPYVPQPQQKSGVSAGKAGASLT